MARSTLSPAASRRRSAFLQKNLDIRLNKVVTEIHYGEQLSIHCGREEFPADRVIVTLPLGVLKAGKVKFSPSLPEAKSAAIRALGFGAAHKVVLRFQRRFWNNTTDFIGFAGDRRGQFVEWTDLSRVLGEPILSLWSHGNAARRLDQLPKDKVVDVALAVIQRVFGRQIPEAAVTTSSWSSDPFSLGAYVNLPVGATFEHLDALAEPVGDRLFFAGEATSRRHRGTVHGAWLSGQKAAETILAAARRE